jgi:hypothetical protein
MAYSPTCIKARGGCNIPLPFADWHNLSHLVIVDYMHVFIYYILLTTEERNKFEMNDNVSKIPQQMATIVNNFELIKQKE